MQMAKWILPLALLLPPVASAELWVNLYGYAYHPDRSESCYIDGSKCIERPNERNYGLGLQYDNGAYAVGGGAFKDSFDDWSYYAGAEKQFHIVGPLHAGGQVFVMSRRSFRNYSPFLGVLPVVSLRGERVALNLSYIPEFEAWKMREVFFFYVSRYIR